jgi:hypothetical protein
MRVSRAARARASTRYRDYARVMRFGAHEVIELSSDDDDDDDDVEVTFDAREERLAAEERERLADQQERMRRLEQERQMDRSEEEGDSQSDSGSDSDEDVSEEVEARNGMSRPDDLEDVCAYYQRTRLSESEIRRGRELIARKWTERSRRADFETLSEADLEHLFELYDAEFFAGAFGRKMAAEGHKLEMVPSNMLSKTAGRCTYDPTRRKHRCIYTIEISRKVLRDAFRAQGMEYPVGGLVCRSRLECMQLTLEHEMVHLLMYMWQRCNDPVKRRTSRTVVDGLVLGGHGRTFKRLVLHMFGHTAIRHGIFSSASVGPGTGSVHAGLTVGMSVVVQGKTYKVARCNPKKFVGVDETGKRYAIDYRLVP